MSTSEQRWRSHLVQSALVFVLLLVYQYVTRGELTLPVALLAAGGFFVVSVALDRYRDRD